MAERVAIFASLEHLSSVKCITPAPTNLRIVTRMCSLSTVYEQLHDRRVR